MKIRSIEAVGLSYPLGDKAYGSARGLAPARMTTLVRVMTEDGIEGIGEAQALPGLVRANLEVLKPVFIGTDIHDRDVTWTRFNNRLYHMGLQGVMIAAYSGLNIAMLDALGKGLGLPVCKLIGGKARDKVTAYAPGAYNTRRPEADLEPQLEVIRKGGFLAAKIKIGLGLDSDEQRVAGEHPLVVGGHKRQASAGVPRCRAHLERLTAEANDVAGSEWEIDIGSSI